MQTRSAGGKYPSQFTYGPEMMCTSVAMHWVMACHSRVHPVCSPESMAIIMQSGLLRHRAVRFHCEAAGRSGLLHMHEVLQCCPLPERFVHRELHGCVGRDPDPEVQEYCVALHELGKHLAPGPVGVLFTARAHTSALFSGEHGLFHFDSAVAEVREISVAGVSAVLRIAHGLKLGDEYSVCLVGPRPAE